MARVLGGVPYLLLTVVVVRGGSGRNRRSGLLLFGRRRRRRRRNSITDVALRARRSACLRFHDASGCEPREQQRR